MSTRQPSDESQSARDLTPDDYAYWDQFDSFTIWDGAYLWCEQQPGKIEDTYKDRKVRAILEFISERTGVSTNEWMQVNHQVSRAELIAVAETLRVRRKFLYPEERDKPSFEVLSIQLKQARQERDAALEKIAELERGHDAELDPKERASVAKIIIGMAIDGYRYDLDGRSDAVGEILNACQNLGLSISETTLRTWPKLGKSLLPANWRKS